MKFLGIIATSISAPTVITNLYEFLGDSITAGLRVLWNGSNEGPQSTAAEVAFPVLVGVGASSRPLVNGHGGQSLVGVGTDGAPIANTAFPNSYSGVAYSPSTEPSNIIIYYGTNATATIGQWTTYLTTIRAARPTAEIWVINPSGVNNFVEITAAVAAMLDANIHALDYGSLTFDTTDGIHPSVLGNQQLAAQIVADVVP